MTTIAANAAMPRKGMAPLSRNTVEVAAQAATKAARWQHPKTMPIKNIVPILLLSNFNAEENKVETCSSGASTAMNESNQFKKTQEIHARNQHSPAKRATADEEM